MLKVAVRQTVDSRLFRKTSDQHDVALAVRARSEENVMIFPLAERGVIALVQVMASVSVGALFLEIASLRLVAFLHGTAGQFMVSVCKPTFRPALTRVARTELALFLHCLFWINWQIL